MGDAEAHYSRGRSGGALDYNIFASDADYAAVMTLGPSAFIKLYRTIAKGRGAMVDAADESTSSSEGEGESG